MTVALALGGALLLGSGGFLGGLASKQTRPTAVAAIVASTGSVVLLASSWLTGSVWSVSAILLGALSGIAGVLSLVMLYASLAAGPMSVLAPLTAVVGATVPILFSITRGHYLKPQEYAALLLAIGSVVLISYAPKRGGARPTIPALAAAVLAGTMAGVYLIVINEASSDSRSVPLVANRVVETAILFAAIGLSAGWRRRKTGPGQRPALTHTSDETGALTGRGRNLPIIVAAGFADSIGAALVLTSLQTGELSMVSVLNAMYPAGTVILAAIVLKEHVPWLRWLGLVLALTASSILAIQHQYRG